MAVLLCELGQDDEAHAIFEALAADKFTGITRDGIWLGSIAYLAEVCVWLGDATRAASLYELLVPYAERNIMFGGPTVCFGAAGRLLGMLATTLERWDLAQGHFEAAVQLDTATGGRPCLAHTQHEYAAMLMRRNREGDAALATSLAESALATSRLLGMRALEERAGTLAQTARAHLSQPRYPAGLTEREVEVLRLVAAGKSNHEIARLLFRSRYTVANHVRNILTKTNAANRTEAAGFAMRHGLLKQ
jgi:DNA-binding CsgD family transcriptional regulator